MRTSLVVVILTTVILVVIFARRKRNLKVDAPRVQIQNFLTSVSVLPVFWADTWKNNTPEVGKYAVDSCIRSNDPNGQPYSTPYHVSMFTITPASSVPFTKVTFVTDTPLKVGTVLECTQVQGPKMTLFVDNSTFPFGVRIGKDFPFPKFLYYTSAPTQCATVQAPFDGLLKPC